MELLWRAEDEALAWALLACELVVIATVLTGHEELTQWVQLLGTILQLAVDREPSKP